MKRKLARMAIGSAIVLAPMSLPVLAQPASAVGLDCQGGGQCCVHSSDPNHPDACAPTPPPPPCDPNCLPPIYIDPGTQP